MFRKIVLVLWCTFSFLSCKCEKDVPKFFNGSELLNNPYGFCAHVDLYGFDGQYIDQEFKLLKEIGVTNVRVDFRWSLIQGSLANPKLNFSRLDTIMIKAQQYGIDILPILGYTLPDCMDPWNNRVAWFRYIDGLYKRFGNSISFWELWNEPNLNKVNTRDYDKLCNITCNRFQKLSKRNRLLNGGLAGADIKYVDSLLNCDIKGINDIDIFNFHYYVHGSTPEWLLEHVFPDLSSFLSETSISGKPVWITEIGNTTHNEKQGWNPRAKSCSEEEQAMWLPRLFLLSFAAGIDRVYYYQLRAYENNSSGNEQHYGILHKDLTPKLALYSLKQLVKMCPSGSTRPILEVSDGIYICRWKNHQGQDIAAFWTKHKSRGTGIKLSKKAVAYDIYGNSIKSKIVRYVKPQLLYIVGDFNM